MSWLDDLRYDPVGPLLNSGHEAVEYWTRKVILKHPAPAPDGVLWGLKIPQSILKKQRNDGSWAYPTKKASEIMDYDQIETYRELGFLVEMFGYDRRHPAIAATAEYFFSKQTKDGDFRGIYAAQYTPNYTAAIAELLIKAGYGHDARIGRVFGWLDSVRQDDGGWALAIRTQDRNLDAIYNQNVCVELDRSRPFSHFVTGVILRAYAAHPKYRKSAVARNAARLLVTRFFERDKYTDKGNKHDWTRFSFPFWQTDILASLDVAGQIDPNRAAVPNIRRAKQWFVGHQRPDGLFDGHLLRDRYHDLRLWYAYAICRAFGRFTD